MTGLELAKALQEEQLCSNVIIISGYSNFDYARRAMRANVLDYLLKPIDRQELLTLVEKVWQSLPDNYAAQSARLLSPPHPFLPARNSKRGIPWLIEKSRGIPPEKLYAGSVSPVPKSRTDAQSQ